MAADGRASRETDRRLNQFSRSGESQFTKMRQRIGPRSVAELTVYGAPAGGPDRERSLAYRISPPCIHLRPLFLRYYASPFL
jgi:hypothetical protein